MKMKSHFSRIFLLSLTLFFYVISANAQMSDEQVASEAMRMSQQGASPSQIFQQLAKKGVTAVQFQRIRERMGKQGQTSTQQTGTNSISDTNTGRTENNEIETSPWMNDTQPFNPSDTISPQNRIYGQDFFSKNNLSFAPNVNMPTPENYVLGPGDEVIIDVWGDSELNLKYTITPDGYIAIPGLGRIQLSGMNIQQATARIRNSFSSIYSDLDSSTPRTFLGISVGNTRTIKVNVMGEVKMPGTYTMTSFASAFHALYAAGGPNEIGGLRSIRVYRGGRVVANIDLYEYLMKGNSQKDITLRDGDIVKVDPHQILAHITGEVKRPMKYEMKPDESMADLIGYAGGFTGNAFKGNVEVTRRGATEMETYTVSSDQYSYFNLNDGDSIQVNKILDRFTNKVEISGAVNREGTFGISDQIRTVKDLINAAQGVRGDAYLQRGLLYRQLEDFSTEMQSVNIDDLLKSRIADIPLRKNDKLFIPSIYDLNDSISVNISGAVRNPGRYPYATNMSVEDIILRAGGLKEEASLARVDVYRRIKDPYSTAVSKQTGLAYSFTLNDGLALSTQGKTFTLEPYDEVVVRSSPGYKPQQVVTVEGEVLFGGKYTKLSQGERMSSLIKRAGGLTPEAYAKGARLIRLMSKEEVKLAIDAIKADLRSSSLNKTDMNNMEQLQKYELMSDSELAKELNLTHQFVGIDLEKALKRPGSDDDIVLREGDIINVPFYTGTVKISGGVNYPLTVTYKRGMTVDGYVRQAGGYSRLAMSNKPFVIHMNGKGASGKWAKVLPGSEIIVPTRPEREPMSPQAIMSIATSVGTLALLVANFFK